MIAVYHDGRWRRRGRDQLVLRAAEPFEGVGCEGAWDSRRQDESAAQGLLFGVGERWASKELAEPGGSLVDGGGNAR